MTLTTRPSICSDCGAYNDGTRFCESCGSPASHNLQDDRYVPAAPTIFDQLINPKVSSVGFVIATIGYAVMLAVPPLASLAANQVGSYSSATFSLSAMIFLVPTVLALIVGSASAPSSGGRRWGGVGLAVILGLIVLIALGAYGAWYSDGLPYQTYILFQYLVAPCCFLFCWAGATDQRPRVYVTVPIAAGLCVFTAIGSGLPLSTPFFVVGDMVAIAIVIASAQLLKREQLLLTLSSPPATTAADGYVAGLAPGAVTRTNTLAVLALIFGILSSLVIAIVLGHMAHAQIRRSGEQGWGMATIGLVLGYAWLVVLAIILSIVVIVSVMQANVYSSYY